MDNLCHSLVGLALAEAGLRRRTRHATATLVVAANLPDVDALLYAAGDSTLSLAGRRGWTHGALALVLLPIALAAAVAWWDAARRRRVRRAGRSAPPPATWRDLALVAALGVWSHALLDWLNSYGVRLLMPFSGEWFYGDALFIIDPWLWLALAVGVLASWGRRRDPRAPNPGRPARLALAACAVYVALLVASAAAGRQLVERLVAAAGGRPARRVMAGPVPLSPLRRDVVRDLGDGYEIGTFHWLPRPRYAALGQLASDVPPPLAHAAARTPRGHAFLRWSRFPLFTASPGRPGRVRIADARYTRRGRAAWAAVEVEVPPAR